MGTCAAGDWNMFGQLGTGCGQHSDPVHTVRSVVLQNVTQISCGGIHTCALMVGGVIRCWGANMYGELGDGTNAFQQSAPSTVVSLANVVRVSCGGSTSCAIVASGMCIAGDGITKGSWARGPRRTCLRRLGWRLCRTSSRLRLGIRTRARCRPTETCAAGAIMAICSWASGRRTRRALCCRRQGWCCRTWRRCRVGHWPCIRARR